MTHNAQHVIIHSLISTGKFSPAEVAKLEAIGEKEGRCSVKDAECVARIVKKKLREVD